MHINSNQHSLSIQISTQLAPIYFYRVHLNLFEGVISNKYKTPASANKPFRRFAGVRDAT